MAAVVTGTLTCNAALDICFMEQEWQSIALMSARQAAASLSSKVQREVSSFPTEQYAETWQRLLQGQGQQGMCKLTLEAKYRYMTLLLARLHVLDTQPSQQDVRRSRQDQCIPWYHLRCLEQQQIRSSVSFSCCELLQNLLLFILECLDTQEALIESSSPKRRKQRSRIGTHTKKHAANDIGGRMFSCHHALQPSMIGLTQLTYDTCLLALPYAMHLLGHAVACTREINSQLQEQVPIVPDMCQATSDVTYIDNDKETLQEPPLTAVSIPCTDNASELQPIPSDPIPRETAQNPQPAQLTTQQNYDVPAAVWQQAAHHLWLRPVVPGVADVPVYIPSVLHMHSAQQGWGSWASTMWRISPPAACTQALWGFAAWQQVEARYVLSNAAVKSASQEYAVLMRQLKALRAKVTRADCNDNDLQPDYPMHQIPSYQALAKEASQLSMTALQQLDAWTHNILCLDAWRQLQRTYNVQQSASDQYHGKYKFQRPSDATVNHQNADKHLVEPASRSAFITDDLAAVLELSSYVTGLKCAFREATAWLAPLQQFAGNDIFQQLACNPALNKCISNQGMWGDALALGITNPSGNGTDQQDAGSDAGNTEQDLTNCELHDQVEGEVPECVRGARQSLLHRNGQGSEAVNRPAATGGQPSRGSLLWSRAKQALIEHLDPASTNTDNHAAVNEATCIHVEGSGAEWGNSTSSACDDGASWSGDEPLSGNLHINSAACDNDFNSVAAEDSATALPQRDDTFHDPTAMHSHRPALQRISEANRPSRSGSENTSTLASRIGQHRSVSQQGLDEVDIFEDDMAAMQYDTPAWAYEAKLSESGIIPDLEGDATWPRGRPWNLASSDFGRPVGEGLDSDAASSSVASLPVSPTVHTTADMSMQPAVDANGPAASKGSKNMKGFFKRWLPSGRNKDPKPKPQSQQQVRVSVEDLGGIIMQDDTDQLSDEDEALLPTQVAEEPEERTTQAKNDTVCKGGAPDDEQLVSLPPQQLTSVFPMKTKPKPGGLFSKLAKNVLSGRTKAAPPAPALGHGMSFNSHFQQETQTKPQGLIRFVSLRPQPIDVEEGARSECMLSPQHADETAVTGSAVADDKEQLPEQNYDGIGDQAHMMAAQEIEAEQCTVEQGEHKHQGAEAEKGGVIAAADEIQQALEAIARTQAAAARYVSEAHAADLAVGAGGCSISKHDEGSEVNPGSLPTAGHESGMQGMPDGYQEPYVAEIQAIEVEQVTTTKPSSMNGQNASGERPDGNLKPISAMERNANPWTATAGLSDDQRDVLPPCATAQAHQQQAQHTLPQPDPDSKGPLAQAMLTRMRTFLSRKQQANDDTLAAKEGEEVLRSPSTRPSFALLAHMRPTAQDAANEAELEYQQLAKEANTTAQDMANEGSQRGTRTGLENMYIPGRTDSQMDQEVRSTPGQAMALDSTRRIPSPSAWARRWRSQVSARAVAAALAAVDAPQRIPRPTRRLQVQTGRSIAKAAALASILEKQRQVKEVARQVLAEAVSQAGRISSRVVTLVRAMMTELQHLSSCVELYTKPNSLLSKTATTEWSKLMPDIRELQQLCNCFLGNSSMAQLMFVFPDAIERLGDLSVLALSTAATREAKQLPVCARTTDESSIVPRCSEYTTTTIMLTQPAFERGIQVEIDRPTQALLEGSSAGGSSDVNTVPNSEAALRHFDSQQLPNLPAVRTTSRVPSRPSPFLQSNVLQGDNQQFPPAAIHEQAKQVHNHSVANPSQALIKSIDTSVLWSLCQYSVRLIHLRQLPAAVCFTPLSILTDVHTAESRLHSVVREQKGVDNAVQTCDEVHNAISTSEQSLPTVVCSTAEQQQAEKHILNNDASVDGNGNIPGIQLQVRQHTVALLARVAKHLARAMWSSYLAAAAMQSATTVSPTPKACTTHYKCLWTAAPWMIAACKVTLTSILTNAMTQVLQEEAEAIVGVVEAHHNPLDLSWLVKGFELCSHASQLLAAEVPHIPTWQTVWQLTNSRASSPAHDRSVGGNDKGTQDVDAIVATLTNRVTELKKLNKDCKQGDQHTTRLLNALVGPDGMQTIKDWYVDLKSSSLRPTPDASSFDSRPLGPLAKAACDKAARLQASSITSGTEGNKAAAPFKGIFTHFISTTPGHSHLTPDHYIALNRMNGTATLQTVANAVRTEAASLLKTELLPLLEQMMSLTCSEAQPQPQLQPHRHSGPGNQYPARETVEIWNVPQTIGGANQLISDSIKRHQHTPQPVWESLLAAIAKLGNLATAAAVLDAALLRQKVQQGLWSAAHLGMAVDMENGCFVPTELSAPAAIRTRILGYHLPTFHAGSHQAHTCSAAHLACDHLAVFAWDDMQPEAWLPSFLSDLSSNMETPSTHKQQAATGQEAKGAQLPGRMPKEQVAKACGEIVLQLALRRMLACDAPMRSSKTLSPSYGQGSVLQGTALLLALTGLPQNHPVHSQCSAIMKTAQQEITAYHHHHSTPACHWANNQLAHTQNVASLVHPVSISQPAGQIHAFIQSAGSVLKDWAVACMHARCMATTVQPGGDDKVALQSAKAHVHDIHNNEGSIQLGTVQAAVAARLLPPTNRDVKKRNAAWGYKDHWADRAVALTASLDVQASMSDIGVRDQQLEAMQRVAATS